VKVKVYSVTGKAKGSLKLPDFFREEVREDLIKRAVVAAQSARYQPQGVDWYAGKRTSAYSLGPGRGVSRVPRIKGHHHPTSGRGAIVPQAVGGRAAHPPTVEKKIKKRINHKEKLKALRSAIAATARKDLVLRRGHRMEKILSIPLVVEDKLESLKTTSDSKKALEKLKVWEDVLRAKEKKVRAGKGKMRGRKYKEKKSLIIVVAKDKGISRAARNLPGVDVVEAAKLGVEDLAPGTHCGRLALYTKKAVSELAKRLGVRE
jgi:large subunit ribosomal protein L4e